MDILSYAIGKKAGGGVQPTPPSLTNLNAVENGTYNHGGYDGYDEVTVNVPNSYSAADEGKVVSSGALVSQTSTTKTENGTYDTTLNSEVVVNVSQPSGSTSITTNGTHNVSDYAEASVNVPNSYSQSDEGKVVSNGALTAQTAATKTENGTYDTTLNNSITVNVPTSTPDLEDITITQNGTYTHQGHDGYDEVSVNVPNSYAASDEGKVVSSGALVGQTSTTKTVNGTYDTTLNNEVVVNVPSPSGNINITDMNSTDVTAYATAQVVDADLVAGNIKKDVNILGVVGTYEGSGREYNVLYYRGDAFNKQNGRSQQPDGNTWACASLPIASLDFRPFINSVEITGFTGLASPQSGWMPGLELDFGSDSATANLDITISQKFWDDLYASSKEEYKRIAFFRCNQTSLNLPYTEYIGTNCFQGCTSLTSISIPSVIGIGSYAFSGCNNLTSIILPSSLTTIGNSAFANTKLTSISIPSGVSSLQNYCFQNCYDLSSVTIPSSVTTIGSNCFQGCSSLTSISIPSGVTSIGLMAFSGAGLQSVIFKGTPTSIKNSVFQNCNHLLDIYVPWSEGEVANAPWSATNATIHYDYVPEGE